MALELKTKRSLVYKKLIGAFFVFATALQPIIAANIHNVLAISADTSSTTFVNDPKYVRQNNSGDLAAQLVTPDTTTAVHFFVDGNTGTSYSGQNVGGAGADTSWWRLYTPLAAGEHTISAEIETGGDWETVADTGIVYSLDAPWAEYVIPQANQTFRPNDMVVRIKADDQFDQFDHMNTTIGSTDYTVTRNECNDKGSYVFCDLADLNLADGTYSAKTTTYTRANNRVDNLKSVSFAIDGTAPVVQTADIDPSNTSPYEKSVDVTQTVIEDNNLNGVSFYVTKPRADGQCDPNQPKVIGPIDAQLKSHVGSIWTYKTDNVDTSSLDGTYCFFSVAEDAAKSHSDPQDGKFSAVFDNHGPTVVITSPTGTVSNKDKAITVKGTVDQLDAFGVDRVDIQVKNGTEALNIDGSKKLIQATVNGDGTWQATIPANTLPEGNLTVVAISKDSLHKTDTDTQAIKVDNTGPVLSNLTAAPNPDAASTYILSVTTNEPAESVDFQLDGMDIAATSTDGGLTWTVITGVLNAETSHKLQASATDSVGNPSSIGSISFKVPAVVVSAVGGAAPQTLRRVNPPLNVAATGSPNQSSDDDNGDVLGAKDTNNDVLGAATQPEEQVAAIARSPQGWQLWGVAWYWWLVIVAGVGGAGWWLLASRKHSGTGQF